METKLKEMFGENMHETGREGGEISYQDFVSSLENIQRTTFFSTNQGKIALSKTRTSMTDTIKRSNSSGVLSTSDA
jgi:hypothetical protein